ncbi:PKD domain-containing protein [Salinivirga cyanobacteriivorans]
MKKFAIVFLLIFSTIEVFNQELEPIVDTNKMWVVFRQSAIDPPGGFGKSYAYKISDSILINSNYWFKVWQSQDSLFSDWNQYGYIREENNKVYYMDPEVIDFDTIIMYDFSLEIGDTVTFSEGCDWTIYNIDSSLFAGKYRYTQHIDSTNWKTIKHIEGIGSTEGLLGPVFYCTTGGIRTLQCVYENDVLIYHNPIYESCYIYNPYTCHSDFTYQIDSLTATFTNESTGYYDETYWNFGDGQSSTEENPTHVFQDTGVYEVSLSIYDSLGGCNHQHSTNITISETHISPQNDIPNKIEIFPNPVKNSLKVNNAIIGSKIQIINSLGNIVYESILKNEDNEIFISDISGFLILRIIDKKGKELIIKKIIK